MVEVGSVPGRPQFGASPAGGIPCPFAGRPQLIVDPDGPLALSGPGRPQPIVFGPEAWLSSPFRSSSCTAAAANGGLDAGRDD